MLSLLEFIMLKNPTEKKASHDSYVLKKDMKLNIFRTWICRLAKFTWGSASKNQTMPDLSS